MSLAAAEEEAEKSLALFRQKHQNARARLLEALIQERELPSQLVTRKLNVTAPVITSLENMGLLRRRCARNTGIRFMSGRAAGEAWL